MIFFCKFCHDRLALQELGMVRVPVLRLFPDWQSERLAKDQMHIRQIFRGLLKQLVVLLLELLSTYVTVKIIYPD